ncbi:MAG: hypothetical protein IJS58_06480 [Bacilli bacterium]|nr:hypothetical protein [Bacilli bacterium]
MKKIKKSIFSFLLFLLFSSFFTLYIGINIYGDEIRYGDSILDEFYALDDSMLEYTIYGSMEPYWSSIDDNFGYNVATPGTCVNLATAMYLGYFDDIYNDNIITNSNYEPNDGIGTTEALHQYMITYGGTTGQPNIFNTALTAYFSNLSPNVCFGNISFQTYIGYSNAANVLQSYPCVGFFSDGETGHCVVTCGILEYNNEEFVLCHIGHHVNQPIRFIPTSYFVECRRVVGLEYVTGHQYLYVMYPNNHSLGHIKNCVDCDYSAFEAHNLISIGLNRYQCTKCGYTFRSNGPVHGIENIELGD